MKQMSIIGGGFEKYTTATRGEQFLAEMDGIVPWEDLCRRIIAPYYPKADGGCPPKDMEMVLRIYSLQLWLNLSGPAVERTRCTTRVACRAFRTSTSGRRQYPMRPPSVASPPAGAERPGTQVLRAAASALGASGDPDKHAHHC
jgi:IS5 family transposase